MKLEQLNITDDKLSLEKKMSLYEMIKNSEEYLKMLIVTNVILIIFVSIVPLLIAKFFPEIENNSMVVMLFLVVMLAMIIAVAYYHFVYIFVSYKLIKFHELNIDKEDLTSFKGLFWVSLIMSFVFSFGAIIITYFNIKGIKSKILKHYSVFSEY
jgi:hypothetical protein